MLNESSYRDALYFDAVRRYGSVREAARQLHLAASAINRQILSLEKEFGLPLFERLTSGMRLTAAGEIMARHAISVLQDERRALYEFDALRGLRRGELLAAAAESLNAHFLPAVISRMAKKYPGIRLNIRTAGSNEIPGLLRCGKADLGIAFSLPRNGEIQQLVVGKFCLGAIMPSSHPLSAEASGEKVSIAQCAHYPLILPGAKISIRALLETSLRRFGGRLQIAAETNSMALMKTLVFQLNAVAFQPRLGVEAEIASGEMLRLPLTGPRPRITEIGVYLRRGHVLSLMLDAFVAPVREQLAMSEGME